MELETIDFNEKVKMIRKHYTLKEMSSLFNVSLVCIFKWLKGGNISEKNKRKIIEIYSNLESHLDSKKNKKKERKKREIICPKISGLGDFLRNALNEKDLEHIFTPSQMKKIREIRMRKLVE